MVQEIHDESRHPFSLFLPCLSGKTWGLGKRAFQPSLLCPAVLPSSHLAPAPEEFLLLELPQDLLGFSPKKLDSLLQALISLNLNQRSHLPTPG
jgi:hypothetical protein